MIAFLFFCAIELSGVKASELQARAYFDEHNVKVGDPMVLTVDFWGEANFEALHPPKLERMVSAADWKLVNVGAKTETFGESGQGANGRGITYRVRPRRSGVLWFPGLEFTYRTEGGEMRTVRTRPMPVHVKAGRQVQVAELGEDPTAMPMPGELIVECPAGWEGDLEFAWHKACARPTAAAFAELEGTEARLNEARCAILEGNWARALKLYQVLEWQIGQTADIERGMIAALARKYDNPGAELPVWRQVGRPLLKYAWPGRLGLGLGGLALLWLVGWLLNRGIRAVAVLVPALLLVLPAAGETVVKETVTTNADGSITRQVVKTVSGGNGGMTYSFSSSSTSGGSMTRGLGSMQSMFDDDFFASPFQRTRRRKPVRPVASVNLEGKPAAIGEEFKLVLKLELPKEYRLSDRIAFLLDRRPGMSLVRKPYADGEEASANPSNYICRYVFPYRALQPIKGPIDFTVQGAAEERARRRSFLSVFGGASQEFELKGAVTDLVVKELPVAGRPADFFGVVADEVTIRESLDLRRVETNDVITLTYRVEAPGGYVPPRELPAEVAHFWRRNETDTMVMYRRYLVADGIPSTPRFSIPYYSPAAGEYRRAFVRPTPIEYQ